MEARERHVEIVSGNTVLMGAACVGFLIPVLRLTNDLLDAIAPIPPVLAPPPPPPSLAGRREGTRASRRESGAATLDWLRKLRAAADKLEPITPFSP